MSSKNIMPLLLSGLSILIISVFILHSINDESSVLSSQDSNTNEKGKEILEISSSISKHDNKHLPERLSKEINNVFHTNFENMNKNNSKLNMTVKLTGNENSEMYSHAEITGAVEIENRNYEFEGDGRTVTVNYEGDTYYRIKYGVLLKGIKSESEQNGSSTYIDENTTGIILVNANNMDVFKASMTVGYANKSAALFFGDDHKVTSNVEKKAFSIIEEKTREESP